MGKRKLKRKKKKKSIRFSSLWKRMLVHFLCLRITMSSKTKSLCRKFASVDFKNIIWCGIYLALSYPAFNWWNFFTNSPAFIFEFYLVCLIIKWNTIIFFNSPSYYVWGTLVIVQIFDFRFLSDLGSGESKSTKLA